MISTEAEGETATAPSFHCLNCQTTRGQIFRNDCRDLFMGRPGSFDYWRCEACSLVQLHPIPSNLSDYYDEYQVHQRKSPLHNAIRKVLMGRGYFQAAPDKDHLRILDYGCGDGWFVQSMMSLGHEALGYEPNKEYAKKLGALIGTEVLSPDEISTETYRGTFDVVTMHFVMEHVTSLDETFQLARSLLKPGGVFYFLIPNIGSLEFRLFNKNWHGLDAPRHINFLTPSIIEKISLRSGFNLLKADQLSLPNGFAGSLSTALANGYNHALFLALVPLALVYCQFFRDGNLALTLQRSSD